MSTRPLLHESLRNLCRQAMGEQDLGELLKIFLELDTAVQRERGHSYLADPPSDLRHQVCSTSKRDVIWSAGKQSASPRSTAGP